MMKDEKLRIKPQQRMLGSMMVPLKKPARRVLPQRRGGAEVFLVMNDQKTVSHFRKTGFDEF